MAIGFQCDRCKSMYLGKSPYHIEATTIEYGLPIQLDFCAQCMHDHKEFLRSKRYSKQEAVVMLDIDKDKK